MALSQNATSCAPVHFIVPRQSGGEAGTNGKMQTLIDLINTRLPPGTTNSYSVPYPAAHEPYEASEVQGMAAVVHNTTQYAAQCPGSKIVLLGYSQGAQCVMDAVCGGTELFPNYNQTGDYLITGTALHGPSLTKNTMAHVTAVLTYADIGHRANQPYDRGTATKDGIWRRQYPACNEYAHKLRSYCDDNDQRCASGTSHAVHESYFEKYNEEAASWIVERLGYAGRRVNFRA